MCHFTNSKVFLLIKSEIDQILRLGTFGLYPHFVPLITIYTTLQNHRYFKQILLVVAISYTILLLVVTSIPSNGLPDVNDKTAHFLAFALFSITWLLVKANYITVGLSGIALGIFIEIWQGLLPKNFNRSYEVMDMVADGIGTIIGCFIFYLAKSLANELRGSLPNKMKARKH